MTNRFTKSDYANMDKADPDNRRLTARDDEQIERFSRRRCEGRRP
jgi:hypothetical protein